LISAHTWKLIQLELRFNLIVLAEMAGILKPDGQLALVIPPAPINPAGTPHEVVSLQPARLLMVG
jgi:tRNA1(Val) A37 N6-methylase TrmN6